MTFLDAKKADELNVEFNPLSIRDIKKLFESKKIQPDDIYGYLIEGYYGGDKNNKGNRSNYKKSLGLRIVKNLRIPKNSGSLYANDHVSNISIKLYNDENMFFKIDKSILEEIENLNFGEYIQSLI
jgi:hypothetical protein